MCILCVLSKNMIDPNKDYNNYNNSNKNNNNEIVHASIIIHDFTCCFHNTRLRDR